ncbi:hypothetical protein CONPUDRAFT_30971, partial [Coniophora puteana RWD-64-598 SS2]
ILRIICDKQDYTRDLAALARTCLAFREPALDALWCSLDDVDPLLRCLPQNLI